MKLCKDCKHWKPNRFTDPNGDSRDNYDKCLNPKCQHVRHKTDFIRGSEMTTVKPMYCSIARDYHYCGHDAKFFEPIDPNEPKTFGQWLSTWLFGEQP